MATPYGHALASLAFTGLRRPWSTALLVDPIFYLALFSANAPDLDFIPGLLVGNEALYHHRAGHSLGAALLFGIAVYLGAKAIPSLKGRARSAGVLAGLLFALHLLIDLFTADPHPPMGEQILWPLSEKFYLSPWTIFPRVERHPFDWSVIGRIFPCVLVETLLLGPLVAAGTVVRRFTRKSAA